MKKIIPAPKVKYNLITATGFRHTHTHTHTHTHPAKKKDEIKSIYLWFTLTDLMIALRKDRSAEFHISANIASKQA